MQHVMMHYSSTRQIISWLHMVWSHKILKMKTAGNINSLKKYFYKAVINNGHFKNTVLKYGFSFIMYSIFSSIIIINEQITIIRKEV